MSKNDDKILLLKQKIAEKKADVGQTKRFAPLTSCSLDMDGVRYNLHAADKDTLILLLCKLYNIRCSAEVLGLLDDCKICGFSVDNWFSDVKARLAVISQKDELTKLKAMEAQLDKLLSDDKKAELEIDSIAAALNI